MGEKLHVSNRCEMLIDSLGADGIDAFEWFVGLRVFGKGGVSNGGFCL